MKKIVTFDPVSISLPEKMIFRRLGYKTGVTRISALQNAEIKKYMADARSVIHLSGVALRLPIMERSDTQIKLQHEVTFHSRQLAAFLKESLEAIVMAATAGTEIMDAIGHDIAGENVTRGVVYDATASEMVDAALDWIVDYFNQMLRRENKAVTKSRFSAGYGDFPLINQLAIHELLHLENLGVTITDSFMLVPEKSVTAIAGIVG